MHKTAGLILLSLFVLAGCNRPDAASSLPATAAPTRPGATTAPTPAGTLPPTPGPGATTSSTPDESSTSIGGMQIRFLNLADGATLEAALDANGKPQVSLSIEVTGPAPWEVALYANDKPVETRDNPGNATPFRADILWSPVFGAGTYALHVVTYTTDKSGYAETRITVTVTGVPALPTPQTLSPEAARQQISALYRQDFGLDVPYPPVGIKAWWSSYDNPWVSAIYLKEEMYQVWLYPDGRHDSLVIPINHMGDKSAPVCRPAGTLRLMVIFVDYGNLGVSSQEALDALQQAVTNVNSRLAATSQTYGAAQPILQLQASGYFIPPPPQLDDHMLTPATIQSTTGVDPRAFDMTVQVDLDANSSLNGGFAACGCGCDVKDVNIYSVIKSKLQLYPGDQYYLAGLTLGHELVHNLGYPGPHNWPCSGDQPVDTADVWCSDEYWPALLLGWTDTDHDGVVEILDTTPYGMTP